MNAYRLYSVDRAGKIVSGEWLSAASDQEAVSIVHGMSGDTGYEIWNRTTFIAAIAPCAESEHPAIELSLLAGGA